MFNMAGLSLSLARAFSGRKACSQNVISSHLEGCVVYRGIYGDIEVNEECFWLGSKRQVAP